MPQFLPSPNFVPTTIFRVLLGVVALAIAAFCQACGTDVSNADIKPISLIEVREAMASGKDKAILMVDARSARAFAEGHIPGAINLSIAALNERELTIDKRLDAYKILAVYGDDPGSPSAQAMTKRLLTVRYDDVRMFMEGLSAWRRAGLPIEQGGPGTLPAAQPPASPPLPAGKSAGGPPAAPATPGNLAPRQ